MSLRNNYLQSLLHETEDRLRQVTTELDELKSGIDEAVIVSTATPRGEITHANRMMAKIAGYSPEELHGQTYRIFNSGHHPPAFFKRLWDTVTSGRVWKGEIRNKAKDGRFFWIDATIVPLLDEEEEVRQFMSVWRDITAQKFELERAELERAAREYAGRLASVGQFTSDIVHEIRNPLSAMLIRAQMMARNKGIPEEARSGLLSIEQLIRRIEKLIDGVSLLARDGSEDPSTEVGVCKLIRDTTALVQEKLRAMDIQLIIECESDSLKVRGRSVQLSQVLLNMINNSCDAVRTESSKWILVSARKIDKEIEIRVEDSGPGIPDELREKIMQPYFTTKPFGQGTGLGLSMSSQIVQSHGGRLFLDTSVTNTAFIVQLPAL